jgi:hypothetical protein
MYIYIYIYVCVCVCVCMCVCMYIYIYIQKRTSLVYSTRFCSILKIIYMLNSTLNHTNDKLLYVSAFNKLLYFTRNVLEMTNMNRF